MGMRMRTSMKRARNIVPNERDAKYEVPPLSGLADYRRAGLEIAAQREVEVDAVLEALVAQADHAGAGVVGAALGLQHREDVRVDALGIVALGLLLRERRLFQLGGEKRFLFGERAVGGKRGLHFAEGDQGRLGILVEGCLIARQRRTRLGGNRAAFGEDLGETPGERGDEVVQIQQVRQAGRRGAAGAGDGKRRQQRLARGIRALGAGKQSRPVRGKVRAAVGQIRRQSRGHRAAAGAAVPCRCADRRRDNVLTESPASARPRRAPACATPAPVVRPRRWCGRTGYRGLPRRCLCSSAR